MRLEGAFEKALPSPFDGAAEGDFGSSVGATEDFGWSAVCAADFSSPAFEGSAVMAGGVALDPIDAGGDED